MINFMGRAHSPFRMVTLSVVSGSKADLQDMLLYAILAVKDMKENWWISKSMGSAVSTSSMDRVMWGSSREEK
jgi:hypothetical protein